VTVRFSVVKCAAVRFTAGTRRTNGVMLAWPMRARPASAARACQVARGWKCSAPGPYTAKFAMSRECSVMTSRPPGRRARASAVNSARCPAGSRTSWAANVTKIESSELAASGSMAVGGWLLRARRSEAPGLTASSATAAGGRPMEARRAGTESSNPAWTAAQSPAGGRPAVSRV
jgi:hypothetical protein